MTPLPIYVSQMAVYPGSFDPITLGHVDIIRRIQPIFGDITILISQHSSKKYLFSVDERLALVRESLKGIPGIKVAVHEGLTVDYLRATGANVIVRGLRAVTDFEYELVMANMNKKLAPGIETMIVFASPEFYYVASSTVKEVAMHGGSVQGLVPEVVVKALKRKYAAAKGIESLDPKLRLQRNESAKSSVRRKKP